MIKAINGALITSLSRGLGPRMVHPRAGLEEPAGGPGFCPHPRGIFPQIAKEAVRIRMGQALSSFLNVY